MEKEMIRNLLYLSLTIGPISALAQGLQPDKYMTKRFIDKIEIIAGPSLSLNYGNKFLEDYKDDNVKNRRLLKIGYTFALGLNHPISNRLDLNVRLQYEKKGVKTELNNPSNPVNDDSRLITQKDYTYKYFSLLLAPTVSLGSKKKCFFSFGAYYTKIKGIKGYEKTYNTRDYEVSEGHFEGRFFQDLRSDGGIYSVTWMPGLRSFEPFDLGAVLSFGYSIPVREKQNLTIQLVDNFGFKNINRDNPYGFEEKNHTLCLIVGYVLTRPSKK